MPPPPELREPELVYGGGVVVLAALENDALCPRTKRCVFRGGVGLSAQVERRWPTGWGALFGLDIWLADGDSVFEVGVLPMIRLGARYTHPTSSRFHWFAELDFGFLWFGDSFRLSTVGGGAEIVLGGELELSARVALSFGAMVRTFATARFESRVDAVQRGGTDAWNVVLGFSMGLVFFDELLP